MPELERMLSRLGEELDWPRDAGPGGARDGAGCDEPGPRAAPRASPACSRRAGLRRSLALAAVALLLLAGTVFAAVPGVRDAVLDFLGLQGATVERRETLPTPPPERPLDLGTRTTLADAAATGSRFAPLVPAGPRASPTASTCARGAAGRRAVARLPRAPAACRARAARGSALLVSEFRGDLSPDYLGKVVGQGTTVERLRVDGDPRDLDRGRAALPPLSRPRTASSSRAACASRRTCCCSSAAALLRPARGRLRPRPGGRDRPLAALALRRPAGAAGSRTRAARTRAPRRPPRRSWSSCRRARRSRTAPRPVIAIASRPSPTITMRLPVLTIGSLSCRRNSRRWCAVGAIRQTVDAVVNSSVIR